MTKLGTRMHTLTADEISTLPIGAVVRDLGDSGSKDTTKVGPNTWEDLEDCFSDDATFSATDVLWALPDQGDYPSARAEHLIDLFCEATSFRFDPDAASNVDARAELSARIRAYLETECPS